MTHAGALQGRVRWPKRLTLLLLCFLAAFVCYIDRVNISVAAIAMQERFGWSETTTGLVLSCQRPSDRPRRIAQCERIVRAHDGQILQ